jgi:hypothetical protein
MGRTVQVGDGGANPPHGSTTTPAQARAIVEPLVLIVQAMATASGEQTARYERLLHALGAAGSGTLGRPGAVEQIERQWAEVEQGAEAMRSRHALLDDAATAFRTAVASITQREGNGQKATAKATASHDRE